jgi:hypothetical protein
LESGDRGWKSTTSAVMRKDTHFYKYLWMDRFFDRVMSCMSL